MSAAPTPAAQPVGTALATYARAVRARWPLVVLGTVIGLIGAFALLVLRPPIVTATAVVQVDVITANPFSLDRAASTLLDPTTEHQIAGSYVVAEMAAEKLDGRMEPREVQVASTALLEPQGTVVRIRFSAIEENYARMGADAVASSYLEYRGEHVEQRIGRMIAANEDRVAELNEQQAEALAVLDDEGGGAAASEAQSTFERVSQEIDALMQEQATLRSISTQGGQVLTPAAVSDVFYTPAKRSIAAGGLVGGVLLGVGLALLRHRTGRHFVHRLDIASCADAPVFGADPSRSGRTMSWSAAADLLVGSLPLGTRSLGVVNLVSPSARTGDVVDNIVQVASAEFVDIRHLDSSNLAEIVRLVRQVDAVAIIVDSRRCPKILLAQIVEALQQLGKPIIGLVDVPRPGASNRRSRAQRGNERTAREVDQTRPGGPDRERMLTDHGIESQP